LKRSGQRTPKTVYPERFPMPGNKKPRKPRPAPSGPPKVIKDFAKNYVCGHCRSRVAEVAQDASGIYHVRVFHDNGCPVLSGALTDMPDMVRAAIATGHVATVIGDPDNGGAG
jgi:hypothetical protein